MNIESVPSEAGPDLNGIESECPMSKCRCSFRPRKAGSSTSIVSSELKLDAPPKGSPQSSEILVSREYLALMAESAS